MATPVKQQRCYAIVLESQSEGELCTPGKSLKKFIIFYFIGAVNRYPVCTLDFFSLFFSLFSFFKILYLESRIDSVVYFPS